jgi:ribosome-associated translation inhibitor RaiA
MQVQVLFESRSQEVNGLRELVVRRAQFATRRLMWLFPSAEVKLSNTSGLHAGVEKRCQVRLQTHWAGSVVATSIGHDWRAAVDDALARAVRRLMRQRRRAWEHRPRPHPLRPIERRQVAR